MFCMAHFKESIFRAYDIRGLAGKELDESLATCLGLAFGAWAQERHPGHETHPKIAVGWDCRLTSDAYATALTDGLLASGVDVVRLGVCPTPLTYFSLFHLKVSGAIMVTGSHNSAEYNGFKLCLGQETLYGEQIQALRVRMERCFAELALRKDQRPTNPPVPQPGSVSDYAIIPAYLEELLSQAPKLERKKIVLDAGNGTASTVAPQFFERLGATVIPLFCELDGRFPNHHPDPTVDHNLEFLIKTVREEKADFGIAFDGDADRIGVVDEQGRIIRGDELMILLARSVLAENPGATIISEVKSSYKLYADIAKRGGVPLMWKTGHSLIKAKMKETGAILAGEMSGHIFFADRYYGYDDAIYAGLRVYEIVSRAGHQQPLSTLLADLPVTLSTPELRIDCEDEKKFQLVAATEKILALRHPELTVIDGIRLDYADGWGLVRASNTQPALVLRFEATSEQRLFEIQEEMLQALAQATSEVLHPALHFDFQRGNTLSAEK